MAGKAVDIAMRNVGLQLKDKQLEAVLTFMAGNVFLRWPGRSDFERVSQSACNNMSYNQFVL